MIKLIRRLPVFDGFGRAPGVELQVKRNAMRKEIVIVQGSHPGRRCAISAFVGSINGIGNVGRSVVDVKCDRSVAELVVGVIAGDAAFNHTTARRQRVRHGQGVEEIQSPVVIRVQVDQGGIALPLEVLITFEGDSIFHFDRKPYPFTPN